MKRSISLSLLILATFVARESLAAPPASTAKPDVAPPAPVEESSATRAAKLRDQGNDAMLSMRYADALAAYSNAITLTPDEAGLFYSLARAHQFLGDYADALAALEAFEKVATPSIRAKVPNLAALYAEIRPRVGLLQLSCDTPGARVLFRDKVLGATPLPPTRLLSGAGTLQIELDGFFTETRDVAIPGNGELALKIDLHRKSTSGLLTITTNPIGALVHVDGKEIGTSAPKLELPLTAGPHDVLVEREGFDSARVPIVLSPGALRDLTIPLEPSRPVYTRWWFWTTVGVVIAGGILTTYALTTERHADHGSLTPGQVSGP